MRFDPVQHVPKPSAVAAYAVISIDAQTSQILGDRDEVFDVFILSDVEDVSAKGAINRR